MNWFRAVDQSVYRRGTDVICRTDRGLELGKVLTEDDERQAIASDPKLAFAHGYLALVLAIGHALGLVNDPGTCEEALAARLRAGEPPVFVRVHEGAVLVDPRTLLLKRN